MIQVNKNFDRKRIINGLKIYLKKFNSDELIRSHFNRIPKSITIPNLKIIKN